MGPSLVESANQCCRSKIFRCGSRSTYFVMMPIRILAPRLRLYLDPNPEPGGKLLNKKSFCKSCKTKNSNFFCKCYGKSWEINESWMTIKMFVLLSSLLLLASYYHTLRIRSPDKTLKIEFVRPTNGDWSWLGPNPQHCSWLGPNPQHCSRLGPNAALFTTGSKSAAQRRLFYFGASERDLTGLRFELSV